MELGQIDIWRNSVAFIVVIIVFYDFDPYIRIL